MVLLKLILLPVLFALFSNTGNKVEAESDTLWKFQRYNLVTKFSVSLRLPPPLNIFSLIGILYDCMLTIFRKTCCFGCKKQPKKEKPRMHKESFPSYESSYWRQFAKNYMEMQEHENHVKEYGEKEMEIISSLVDDVNRNEEIIYRIRSQIAQLEADINYTHAHLETLKYRENKEDESNKPFTLHSLSRDSPYPRTKVQRFPVPDKYVPWEVMWLHYEPAVYTQPTSEFSTTLQPYVDDDSSCSLIEETDRSNLPNYLWNMESVDASGVYRNRKSWIIDRNGKLLTYKLDMYGLPRNPMGRTGLRGKGALPRWGPNHNIFIVITRWQKKTSKGSEKSILGTPDLLEFVETWYVNKKDISLPGGFAGSESRYVTIQTLFKEDDNDSKPWESSTDMIQFFQRYAIDSNGAVNEEHVKCEKDYCGYMDDQLNTDQAWKEVELWHIHYSIATNLSQMFKPDVKWTVLTEDVFIRLKDGQTTLLQNAIRSLAPNIDL